MPCSAINSTSLSVAVQIPLANRVCLLFLDASHWDSDVELFVSCQVVTEGQPVGLPVMTTYRSFPAETRWTEWLVLPVAYRDLVPSSTLVFHVWDVASIGAGLPVLDNAPSPAHPRPRIPELSKAASSSGAVPLAPMRAVLSLFDTHGALRHGRQKMRLFRQDDALLAGQPTSSPAASVASSASAATWQSDAHAYLDPDETRLGDPYAAPIDAEDAAWTAAQYARMTGTTAAVAAAAAPDAVDAAGAKVNSTATVEKLAKVRVFDSFPCPSPFFCFLLCGLCFFFFSGLFSCRSALGFAPPDIARVWLHRAPSREVARPLVVSTH